MYTYILENPYPIYYKTLVILFCLIKNQVKIEDRLFKFIELIFYSENLFNIIKDNKYY